MPDDNLRDKEDRVASILDKPTYRSRSRNYSAIFDKQEGAHGVSYNRKQILEFLNEYSDSNGFLTQNCRQLAKLMGVSYQKLSEFISEFVELGYMKKYGAYRATKFRVMHHPDDCDWGPEWKAKVDEIRKRKANKGVEDE